MIGWILFVAGVVLKAADHITTTAALKTGRAKEFNPLIRFLAARSDLQTALAIVWAFWLFQLGILCERGFLWSAFALDVVLFGVVIWNLIQLRKINHVLPTD